MSLRHLAPALLVFASLSDGSLAQSPPGEEKAPEKAPEPEGEREWLEFYYENPTPDRFVGQMKDWAADGTLENNHAKPALIAFISQLIRQHRDRIEEWYEALSGLSPAQRQVLHTGMLFSRTTEADEMMRERFGKAYDEQKRETHKILEMPLDKEGTMDMLWGYFYATGSEGAIRRIVTCFRFIDAPNRPEGVEVPEGYVPLYKDLPQFAHGSLLSNAERHPRLVAILREMWEKDGSLLEREKEGVYSVLSELDPKTWPPKDPKAKKV